MFTGGRGPSNHRTGGPRRWWLALHARHAQAGAGQTRPMRAVSSPPKIRRRFQGGGVTASCHALSFQ